MSKNERRCGLCKHARLPLTMHKPPRVRPDRYGHCAAPPIEVQLATLPEATVGEYRRTAIFSNSGRECKAFEPGKPQAFTGEIFPAVRFVEASE